MHTRSTVILLVLTLLVLHKNYAENANALCTCILFILHFKIDYDLSSDSSSRQPAKPNTRKAHSLEDILHEFGLIERVSYTLF